MCGPTRMETEDSELRSSAQPCKETNTIVVHSAFGCNGCAWITHTLTNWLAKTRWTKHRGLNSGWCAVELRVSKCLGHRVMTCCSSFACEKKRPWTNQDVNPPARNSVFDWTDMWTIRSRQRMGADRSRLLKLPNVWAVCFCLTVHGMIFLPLKHHSFIRICT